MLGALKRTKQALLAPRIDALVAPVPTAYGARTPASVPEGRSARVEHSQIG